MVKPTVVRPCSGILLGSKKEQTADTCNSLGVSLSNILSHELMPGPEAECFRGISSQLFTMVQSGGRR